MTRTTTTLLGLLLLLTGGPARADEATYRVTFNATWRNATHGPNAYPTGAHFSPLVGNTHDASVSFWTPGGLASAGIEDMAENGGTALLDAETQAAIDAGAADGFLSGPGINSPGAAVVTFTIRSTHPRVTLVTMVAPSPDWFVGVSGLRLRKGGRWLREAVVDLYAYDAGTDSGNDFTSPDADTDPQDPIALVGDPFTGTPKLGTFTFTIVAECNDGEDNDGDTLFDHPADPGCFAPTDADESPACDDGEDNDNDTFLDHPGDPECIAPWALSENPGCGLGFEIVLVLPPLLWRYRRRSSGPASGDARSSPHAVLTQKKV